MTIQITPSIAIEEWELTEVFARSSGPGGQNVNKVETAVQLRFAAAASPNLPPHVKARLRQIAGRRWAKTGEVVIEASEERSQVRNREAAQARLVDMIRQATVRPKYRVKTKPSRAAKARRTDEKVQRGRIKRLRSGNPLDG